MERAWIMSDKRASIGQVMMVVALVALNLFAFRSMPIEVTSYPTLWVFLGCIDFVVFWKLILRRSLRAFHYTFLIVFVIVYLVMANLVATERFHPLSPLVRWYQQLPWVKLDRISLGFLFFAEIWAACFLSFALAIGVGLVAAGFEKRLNWDVAAFFRGALAGYGVATILLLIQGRIWGWGPYPPIWRIANLLVVAVCLIAGGVIGLSRLKSRPSSPGGA
jgi:hypothetical protein